MSEKQPFPPMLKRLHALAAREAVRSGQTAFEAFDDIGLLLPGELGDSHYDWTPLNVSSFTRTGGDGVHYSLLHIDGQVTDQSPVVMSVPMMGAKGNMIVGENLYDFLCLGCEVGYFWLEQLVYDRADTVEKLAHPEQVLASFGSEEDYRSNPDHQEYVRLLGLLIDEFGLSPWVEIGTHLDDLQARYMHRLEISDPDLNEEIGDRGHRHFPQPQYDRNAPLVMSIQDVFGIDEHAAVAGRIARGVISQGDIVDIVDDCSNTLTSVVSETFLSLLSDISDPALSTGENYDNRNIGLVFVDLSKDQIERGMLIVAHGSMKCYQKFRADIYVYTLAESGYETDMPLKPENRSRFYIFERDRYGHIVLPVDIAALMPGQEMNLQVELKDPVGLTVDTVFPLWVDPPGSTRKLIGEGRITALID